MRILSVMLCRLALPSARGGWSLDGYPTTEISVADVPSWIEVAAVVKVEAVAPELQAAPHVLRGTVRDGAHRRIEGVQGGEATIPFRSNGADGRAETAVAALNLRIPVTAPGPHRVELWAADAAVQEPLLVEVSARDRWVP
jgi:hypothetical protein